MNLKYKIIYIRLQHYSEKTALLQISLISTFTARLDTGSSSSSDDLIVVGIQASGAHQVTESGAVASCGVDALIPSLRRRLPISSIASSSSSHHQYRRQHPISLANPHHHHHHRRRLLRRRCSSLRSPDPLVKPLSPSTASPSRFDAAYAPFPLIHSPTTQPIVNPDCNAADPSTLNVSSSHHPSSHLPSSHIPTTDLPHMSSAHASSSLEALDTRKIEQVDNNNTTTPRKSSITMDTTSCSNQQRNVGVVEEPAVKMNEDSVSPTKVQ